MAAKKRAVESGSRVSGLTHNPFGSLGAMTASGRAAPAREAAEASVLDGKLVIRRELKGRGGKTVTRITGLPGAQRNELASRMKKKLGCGALVDGEDVLLLGDVMDRAAAWLQSQGAKRIVKGN